MSELRRLVSFLDESFGHRGPRHCKCWALLVVVVGESGSSLQIIVSAVSLHIWSPRFSATEASTAMEKPIQDNRT